MFDSDIFNVYEEYLIYDAIAIGMIYLFGACSEHNMTSNFVKYTF